MKRRLSFLLAAILLLAGIFPGRLCGDPAPTPAPVTDATQVAQQFHQVLLQPEYQETDEPDANARLKGWLSDWFTRLGAEFGQFKYAQEMPRFASLLMTLFVLLSIAGLLYTLVRLTRQSGQGPDWTAPGTADEKVWRAPEFYERELHHALAARDWQGAWLASWRQFLSRLEKGRLVEADRSRTNREYLNQLSAHPLPASAFGLMARMVDAYDNFIYGRRPIGEADWNSFHEQVNEATLLLHLQDVPTPQPEARAT